MNEDSGFVDLREDQPVAVTDDFEGWLEAYTELQRQYTDLRNEYAIVIRTVIKTLSALGMWPVTDKINHGAIMKAVKDLMFDAMMPGSSLKDKFSFIKDVIPIAERYKDIDVNEL